VAASVIASSWLGTQAPLYVGRAFDHILSPERNVATLLALVLGLLAVRLAQFVFNVLGNVSNEFLAKRLERDSRDELYLSLLSKSQTFHSRQRTGDLMARATNDVRQLNFMFSPGLRLILSSMMSAVMPIAVIGTIDRQLLVVPVVFLVVLGFTIRDYSRQLNPVAEAQRSQFGAMNARLAEAISGIEVVKANAQEAQEHRRFGIDASRFRDLFVRQGEIQARYVPLLVYYVMLPMAFLHAIYLYSQRAITVGDIVAFMGLLGILEFPTFISWPVPAACLS